MPKTVLMIGAGAVKGGWAAVASGMSKVMPGATESTCNLAFASMVHRARWWWHAAQREPSAKKGLAAALSTYAEAKNRIAEALLRAFEKGNLEFRKYGRELLTGLRAESPDLKIVTTNWDQVLDAELPKTLGEMGRLLLHGIVTTPATMYLPTEALDEVYRDGATERELASLRKGHLLAEEWLRRCDRLVVYGLSLSPLDPELGTLVEGGVSRRTKAIKIEVHDLLPGEVTERLQLFAPARATFRNVQVK